MKRIVAILVGILLLVLPILTSCGDAEKNTDKASQTASKSESKTEKQSAKPIFDNSSDMVYVNPDAYEIPDGSSYYPYASLEEAYAEAVRRINEGETESVTVSLSAGTYFLSGEMTLDGNDFTVDNYAVSFVGEGTDTVITPTVEISGSDFYECDTPYLYYYQFSESEKDENGLFPAFRQLYINGRQLTLARYFDEPVMQIDSCAKAANAENAVYGIKAADRILYVRPDTVNVLTTDKDGYFLKNDANGNPICDNDGNPVRMTIEYCVKTEWQCHIVHADRITGPLSGSVDTGTGEELLGIHILAEDWNVFNGGYTGSLVNCSYWTQNHLDFCDSEGEFYYDRENGYIYVYTAQDLGSKTVSYPIAERIFNLKDVKNICFESLSMFGETMNYATDYPYVTGQGGSSKRADPTTGKTPGFLTCAAIYGKNVANISVYDCTIHDVGNDGIFFCGAVDGVSVSSCVFENIGAAAVRIGQNVNTYNDTVHSKDIVITDNYLYNIDIVSFSAPAIMISSVLNLELSYNTILHCQYSGISVGLDWTDRRNFGASFDTDAFVNVKNANISHNYISEYMIGMSDGGAIYVLGGNATLRKTEYLNSMNNNVCVLHTQSAAHGRGHCMTYYHDSGASHWYDYDNMILIAPETPPPVISYVYYDASTSYQNKTERVYIVGYPIDHVTGEAYPTDYNDSTNETIVGWYTVLGTKSGTERKRGYRATIDPETGAYDIVDVYYKNLNDYVEDVYLYHSFDDATLTDEAYVAMENIYENAGCTLYTKPEYGVMPEN